MKCLHNSISTPQTVDQKNLHTVSSQLIQGKYKNRLWNEFQSSKKGLLRVSLRLNISLFYSRKETHLGKLFGLRSVKYFASLKSRMLRKFFRSAEKFYN